MGGVRVAAPECVIGGRELHASSSHARRVPRHCPRVFVLRVSDVLSDAVLLSPTLARYTRCARVSRCGDVPSAVVRTHHGCPDLRGEPATADVFDVLSDVLNVERDADMFDWMPQGWSPSYLATDSESD